MRVVLRLIAQKELTLTLWTFYSILDYVISEWCPHRGNIDPPIELRHNLLKGFNCGHFYRPKRSFGQGNIFTGVCLSTGGVPFFWGCLFWGVPFWGGAFLGGVPFLGGAFFWGGAFFGRGVPPPEYGQRSAGTHPTGMHSCVLEFLIFYLRLETKSFIIPILCFWKILQ